MNSAIHKGPNRVDQKFSINLQISEMNITQPYIIHLAFHKSHWLFVGCVSCVIASV